MKERNYWVVSPNVKNNDEEKEWKEFLSTNPYSFIGWNENNKLGKTFINKIKKGDVIINAQRKNWEPHVFGVGIVLNDKCEWKEIKGLPSGAYCRQLKPYLTEEKVSKLNSYFKDTTYYKKNKQIPAIYQLNPQKNENDKILIEIIDKKLEMETDIQKIKELLEANKNLILTGAPGTGKTYLAKEIAKTMIGAQTDDDLEKKRQFGFVQFHPSYDYTDFVEGLRPTKPDENGNIGFELKNGIFKEFCEEAKKDKEKKFVFVIDEINRGEISKIFGELFFSIDPSYRGEIGSVKTQYSNLHDDINEMFYVPENVYIIGTMNDIDRSVESFDFAMRRRFVWKEITDIESQQMFDNESWEEEASKRMNKLNTAIENIEGLNSSYHIGAAYFKNNLPKYNDGEKWDKLWELHLKPLLSEYLRGMSDQEKKLESLENAYYLK